MGRESWTVSHAPDALIPPPKIRIAAPLPLEQFLPPHPLAVAGAMLRLFLLFPAFGVQALPHVIVFFSGNDCHGTVRFAL